MRKDGCIYAPSNLVKDLARHKNSPALGVLYIADERKSKTERAYARYGNANRRARNSVESILPEVSTFFSDIYPKATENALLREFPGWRRC